MSQEKPLVDAASLIKKSDSPETFVDASDLIKKKSGGENASNTSAGLDSETPSTSTEKPEDVYKVTSTGTEQSKPGQNAPLVKYKSSLEDVILAAPTAFVEGAKTAKKIATQDVPLMIATQGAPLNITVPQHLEFLKDVGSSAMGLLNAVPAVAAITTGLKAIDEGVKKLPEGTKIPLPFDEGQHIEAKELVDRATQPINTILKENFPNSLNNPIIKDVADIGDMVAPILVTGLAAKGEVKLAKDLNERKSVSGKDANKVVEFAQQMTPDDVRDYAHQTVVNNLHQDIAPIADENIKLRQDHAATTQALGKEAADQIFESKIQETQQRFKEQADNLDAKQKLETARKVVPNEEGRTLIDERLKSNQENIDKLKPKKESDVNNTSTSSSTPGVEQTQPENSSQGEAAKQEDTVPWKAGETTGQGAEGVSSEGETKNAPDPSRDRADESSVTPEAEELLKSEGVPAFMTNNLKRIAKENDIEVTDKTTPDDVINQLKSKYNAIPKRSTEALPVDASSGDSEKVGGEVQNEKETSVPQEKDHSTINTKEGAHEFANDNGYGKKGATHLINDVNKFLRENGRESEQSKNLQDLPGDAVKAVTKQKMAEVEYDALKEASDMGMKLNKKQKSRIADFEKKKADAEEAIRQEEEKKLAAESNKPNLLSKVKKYNALGRKARQTPQGVQMLSDIQRISKALKLDQSFSPSGKVQLSEVVVKLVRPPATKRSPEAIREAKERKAERTRLIKKDPSNLKDWIYQHLLSGGKVNVDDYLRVAGKEVSPDFKRSITKDGTSFHDLWESARGAPESAGFTPEDDYYFNEEVADAISDLHNWNDLYKKLRASGIDENNKELIKQANAWGVNLDDIQEEDEAAAIDNVDRMTEEELRSIVDNMPVDGDLEEINTFVKDYDIEEPEDISKSGTGGDVRKETQAASVEEASLKYGDSPEVKAKLKEYNAAQRAYESAKEKFGDNTQQNQVDIFGKSKQDELLFKHDLSDESKTVKELKDKADKLKSELNELSKKAEVSPSQQSLFEEGKEPVSNYKTQGGEDIPFTSAREESNKPGQPDLFSSAGETPDYTTRLRDGDICWMERALNEKDNLQLTGPAKIKSSADVAYLFRHLESAASENAFAVLHGDNGAYKVLYLSTGSTAGTVVDPKLIYAAAKEFNSKAITFVHNHPSGNLTPSAADHNLYGNIKKSFEAGGIEVKPGVIINLDSGKYAEFTVSEHDKKEVPTDRKDVGPVKVHQFDKQILHKPSSERVKISSSRDAAEFLSIQKRGSVPKLGIMILDRNNAITKYIMEAGNLSEKELVDKVLSEVGKHGDSVILLSNAKVSDATMKAVGGALRNIQQELLDVIHIKNSKDILKNYESYTDEGKLVREPDSQAMVNEPSASSDKKDLIDSAIKKAKSYIDDFFSKKEKPGEVKDAVEGAVEKGIEHIKKSNWYNELSSPQKKVWDDVLSHNIEQEVSDYAKTSEADNLYATKNAHVIARATELGYSDELINATKSAARDFGKVWDEAEKQIKDKAIDTDKFRKDLADNPVPADINLDTANAVLLHDQIDLENKFDKVNEAINSEGITDKRKNELLQEKAQIQNDLYDNMVATKKLGTELGRGLNARKMLADKNFSLANMHTELRSEQGGKPLTPEQEQWVEQRYNDIRQKAKAWDDFQKNYDEERRKLREDITKQVEKEMEKKYGDLKKTITQRGKILANKIRELKTKPLILKDAKGNPIVVQEAGLNPLNDAIELVAKAVENGAELVDAIKEGIDSLKDKGFYKSLSDEDKAAVDKSFAAHFQSTKSVKSDASKLQAIKTRYARLAAEYRNKLVEGDFSSQEKKNIQLDADAVKLQADLQKAKDDWYIGKEKVRLSQRGWGEKAVDTVLKYTREGLLSGVKTLWKLSSFGLTRQMLIRPLYNIAGKALQVFPAVNRLSTKAPAEGGMNFVALAENYKTFGRSETYKRAWQKFSDSGKSDLDLTYGGDNKRIVDIPLWPSKSHGVIKHVPLQAEMNYVKKAIGEWQKRNGTTGDPAIDLWKNQYAYVKAMDAIYLGDSKFLKQYQMNIHLWEQAGGAKYALSKIAKFLFPIVKVPYNFVKDSAIKHTPVGLAKAMADHYKADIETLSPEEADRIMLLYKKGLVGSAMMVTGIYLAQKAFGGNYSRDDKQKNNILKAGDVSIAGTKVPHWATHNALVESAQIGATMADVFKDSPKDYGKGEDIARAVVMGAMSEAEKAPFYGEMAKISEELNTWKGVKKAAAEQLGRFIPLGIQDLAKALDTKDSGFHPLEEPKPRKPDGFKEEMKMKIPGMRNSVPQKKKRFPFDWMN